jgi:cysteine synthase A
MIHESIVSCIGNTPLVYLRRLFAQPGLDVIAKLEMLNPGGSVKDRPARFIIEQGLADGSITAQTHLIESSSGNLGIALAMVAKIYHLAFTCVVDPQITATNLQILQQLGARIEMVEKRDQHGGYLLTRVQHVQTLLQRIPGSQWVNQYANALNWQAHYTRTAGEILAALDAPIDCLVCAVSTTGTLLGLTRRLREEFSQLHVIAVDAVGSVIFGGKPGPRHIPGIGASRVPELLHREEVDEIVSIHDREAAQGCRDLMRAEGILAGGSSGSVVAALQKLAGRFPTPYRVLTLFADRGDRYLDRMYNDDWFSSLPALSGDHAGTEKIEASWRTA